jgi:uncharacterized protein YkwD
MRRLAAALLVVVLTAAPAKATTTRELERRLTRFTNHARVIRDIAPLDRGWRLNRFARAHSRAMASEGRIFHSHGPSCSYWGENVGVTGGSIWGLHRAFMKSSAHRANVLNPLFRRVGVGVVRASGVKWVTLDFCR